MAHPTSAPFARHSGLPDYPQRHPLSPPETTADSPATAIATPATVPSHLASRNPLDHEELAARLSDSPSARFRRVSTLTYNAPTVRDNRERTLQSRPPKPLVIVIPPPTILHEHGQFGHTLSQGPLHRLSQGILMPLFPTIYGQLTAIAREFNFPSTSGLCIYYHFSDGGYVSTPRVSDESWPFIWSHVFEERSAVSPPRPPISGKIEFDIDTRQARWYTTWLSSSRIERPVPSSPSVNRHGRYESKTTLQEDMAIEGIETPLRPKSRHVPRKLSLVDRYESMSARSTAAPGSASLIPSPPAAANSSHPHLSPIPQADEPLTAKMDLEKRVTSWRSSASLRPSPLALKGQPSLEPANMPNSVPLDESAPPSGEDELNLADYQWSVSSRGPPDYDESESIASVSRIPSVHLAHRAQGSVCLTPSVCTSFGPLEYDFDSPVSNIDRLPSPDIAWRMLEDAPPTPSTVTSWGAPLSYPPSPISERSLFSLDLAHRATFSRPLSPETATSWGPPSWPASPARSASSRAPSLHMDSRVQSTPPLSPIGVSYGNSLLLQREAPQEFSENPESAEAHPWPLVWPYHHHVEVEDINDREISASSTEAVLSRALEDSASEYDEEQDIFEDERSASHSHLVWPYNAHIVDQEASRSIDEPQPQFEAAAEGVEVLPTLEDSEPAASQAPWNLVWPYTNSPTEITIEDDEQAEVASVQPESTSVTPEDASLDVADASTFAILSNVVWSHEELSAAASSGETAPVLPATRAPDVPVEVDDSLPEENAPWKLVWPYTEHTSTVVEPSVDHQEPTGEMHATVASDEAVDVAPVHPAPWQLVWPYTQHNTVDDGEAPPPAAPWHHVWPYNHPVSTPSGSLSVELHEQIGYPYIVIYPDVYPNFNLYPSVPASRLSVQLSQPVLLGESLPYPKNLLSIYPPVLAPPSDWTSSKPYPENLREIYAPLVGDILLQAPKGYPLDLYNIYPSLDLYYGCQKPYPSNLEQIYCDITSRLRVVPPSSTVSRSSSVSSYPSCLYEIYPSLDLYPGASKPYPSNLNEIYRSLSSVEAPVVSRKISYPSLEIYPVVTRLYHGEWKDYPLNLEEIYAQSRSAPPSVQASQLPPISVRLPAMYPHFDLYPAVYPFVNPYPAVFSDLKDTFHSTVYPVTQIYPPVETKMGPIVIRVKSAYPDFEIYPAVSTSQKDTRSLDASALSVHVSNVYPSFNLYPAVYPQFDIYPALTSMPSMPSSVTSACYPYFDLYPEVVKAPKAVTLALSTVLPTNYPHFNLYPDVYPSFSIYPPAALGTMLTEETSPASTRYPFFNLYPAVYPYLDIYPSRYECQLSTIRSPPSTVPEVQTILRPPSVVVQPPTPTPFPSRFASSPPSPRTMPSRVPVPKRRTFKLTHSELHAMVMMEASFNTKSSFDDDDDDDMPHELPRFTPREEVAVSTPPRRALRRGSISQGPSSPNGIPQRVVSFQAPVYDLPSTKVPTSPYGSPPLRRSVSAVTRPPLRLDQKQLNRRSFGLPSSPAALKQLAMSPESPVQSPVKVPPRRRDSLVLQRVRAYNAKDAGESLDLDTISEFPLPPRPTRIPGPR